MGLKDIFKLIIEQKDYDLSGVDSSRDSVNNLIEYVTDTYSDKVECINILSVDDALLDELIAGEDIVLKVTAALSKLDRAIPHINLRSRV